MRKSKWAMPVAIVLSLALIAAACGDDDDTSSGDDGSSDDGAASDDGSSDDGAASDPGAEGLQRAIDFVAQYSDTPTSTNITEPLPARPEEGVNVYWAECSFPVCNTIGDGIQAAADLLGWNLDRVPYNPGNPEEVGSVHLQGIQTGADVLMTSGRPRSEWEEAANLAMERGVPIIDSYTRNPVLQAENGIWSCFGCEADSELVMQLITNWVIQDSGGDATILYSTIPDFPIVAFRDSVVEATVAENCPGCNLVKVEHSIQNLLEGAIPGNLIAQIQENSDAENLYVLFAFGDQAFGFVAALEEVGLLDSVKITGHDPIIESLNNLDAGIEAAWTGNPVFQVGFNFIDCYARIAQDVECDPSTVLPTQVLTPGSEGLALALAFQAESGVNAPYVGDPDFIAKFTELWQLN
jgi:ABC-type sugar transport system substrate-binding protein